ncbi:carbohydrate ABC transporter permease [Sphaerisporangium fuscum]|uniref:carbohydrate ABC transporter permease n=1 Tax=Sphaerisporangium fuscum TaxID=2835868 RepID=UPI001BDD7224|nr:sugar ABC transporter permease [Sphaerisporangium fuscum]
MSSTQAPADAPSAVPATPPAASTAPRRRFSIAGWYPYLFVAPSLFGVVVFLLLPVLIVAGLSFFDWRLLSPPTFAGLGNYRRLIDDPSVGHSLFVTMLYVLLCVPAQTVPALGLAVLLNRRVKGVKIFRAMFVIPWIATPIVLGLIWDWIFNPENGVINELLALVGVRGPDWLSDPAWALPAVALVTVWQHTGYNMLFFLAGLQGIPKELHDAAAADGATPRQRFFMITLPLLNPTMFFVLVTNMIGAFQVFDTVFSMTDGGPSHATEVVNFKIFSTAFRDFDFGYASTLAMLLFVIILVVTLVQVRYFNRRTTYDLS